MLFPKEWEEKCSTPVFRKSAEYTFTSIGIDELVVRALTQAKGTGKEREMRSSVIVYAAIVSDPVAKTRRCYFVATQDQQRDVAI